MNTHKRKAIHNPAATSAAPCSCPACVRYRTAEGRALADDWNGYARSIGARFSILLTGDALSPRLRDGDMLAIDPKRVPVPGDVLLVNFDGNPKKRGVMVLNGDGDLIDLRGAWVPKGAFTIEGVVVAARHLRVTAPLVEAEAASPSAPFRPARAVRMVRRVRDRARSRCRLRW